MNSLEVVARTSTGELAEVKKHSSKSWRGQPAELSTVLKAHVSKTATSGAETAPTARFLAHPWRLGKGSKHLRNHSGESITLPLLLMSVPQDLLYETDNLAQTQVGLFPDGNPVPSVDISPSLDAHDFQGCGSLKGLNVSLHSPRL